MPATAPVHLGVDLEGAGHHPGAARLPGGAPHRTAAVGHWAGLIDLARRATLDFAVVADSLAPPAPGSPVADRLDAVLTLCRVAPDTADIGLIPAATTTHTEPFHLSKAIATLDWVSEGRAGWQAEVSPGEAEARHVGRRPAPPVTELWQEAEEAIDVVRRLWDSWEDDAEIRDVATGRFIDGDKVHHIGFTGRYFSVKGPSIVPRPPQGLPPVVVRADGREALAAGARHADIVRLTAPTPARAAELGCRVREYAARAGREPDAPRVLADLVVLLGDSPAHARERAERLGTAAGPGPGRASMTAEPHHFTGTAEQLADLLEDWVSTAGLDGFTLLPAVLPDDLERLATAAAPVLRARGLLRDRYTATTLRGHLGLPRPASRYTTTRESAG